MASIVIKSILVSLLIASTVSAHGHLRAIQMTGQALDNGPDPDPKLDNPHGPIRQVSTNSPVTDVTSLDIICGPGASGVKAPRSYSVQPGGELTFFWEGVNGKSWGHAFGPMMAYLASCGGGVCTDFDASDAQWYKIDQLGKKDGSNRWFQDDLRTTSKVTVNLPKNIPNGEYLLRHEIVVLDFADKPNGAQFYPSCTQIKITGAPAGVSALPDAKANTVSFPGIYKADDPGILVPDRFKNSAEYVFPGGKVVDFDGEGTSTSTSLFASASATRSSSSAATASSSVTNISISTAPRVSVIDTASSSSTLVTVTRTDSVKRVPTSTSATTDFETSFSTSPSSTIVSAPTPTASKTITSKGGEGDVEVVTVTSAVLMTRILYPTFVPVASVSDYMAAANGSPVSSIPTIKPSSFTSTTSKAAPTGTAKADDIGIPMTPETRTGRTHRYPTVNYRRRRSERWRNLGYGAVSDGEEATFP